MNVPANWYHNGQLLSPSDKLEFFGKGVIHRLTINEADGKDEGEYLIQVKDKKSVAKLSVEGMSMETSR